MQPTIDERPGGPLFPRPLAPRPDPAGGVHAERSERDESPAQPANELAPWQPWQGKRFPKPWDASTALEAD